MEALVADTSSGGPAVGVPAPASRKNRTTTTTTVSLPPPILDAIDRAAERLQTSRSAALRELLTPALSSMGLWPPPAEVRHG
jgi:hypothetical protein